MNLKVRLKNKTFWITFVPTLIALVYMVLSLFDIVPTIGEEKAVEAALAVIGALSTLGVLVDPTTKGIADSAQAMTYETPAVDKVETEVNVIQRELVSEDEEA